MSTPFLQSTLQCTALLGLCFLQGGCSEGVPIEVRDRAEVYLQTQAGSQTNLIVKSIWYMSGLDAAVCGEVSGKSGAAPTAQRFMFDPDAGYGQVEFPAAVVPLTVLEDARTKQLLAENRRVFDAMWADKCEPFRPWW